MNKEAIAERNRRLTFYQNKLRDLVMHITYHLAEANKQVFESQEEVVKTTQSQVFQLLQDRLTEVGTHVTEVHRH